nr:DUF1993 domain-containing protein [Micropepsaceae bacterium]
MTSIHDFTVVSYQQILGAVSGFLDKGAKHCAEHNINPQEFVDARIHPDMLPLSFQINSVAHHSLGAIKGVQAGEFGTPPNIGAVDYARLQAMVAEARDGLSKFSAADVNALSGKDVIFKLGDFKIPFTAEGFLLSFSLPNFYFHATTAYDIL